jgi:uncharacterized membrane protein
VEELTSKKPIVKRIGGYLHKVVPLVDSSGKVVHRHVTPMMFEVRRRDLMQIVVGSSILALPLAYTEETWNLGGELPLGNVILLGVLSMLFISLFVYFNFYRNFLKSYTYDFVKRIVFIYLISLIMVALLLTLIEKCPWGIDNLLAVKRIIIIGLPASMSAAVTDSLK